MSLTLGEKLRQAREERGLTISEVAEQTRISALYLESIENNDFRPLPGGIFNKGFVKSYAKHLGLSEQEALQDYTALLSQQGSDANEEPKTYRPEVLTDEGSRTGLIPTLFFAAVIIGLMIWGIMAFLNYYSAGQAVSQTDVNANKPVNTNTAPATPTPTPTIPTDQIKVEFKALNGPVSLIATSDGKKSYPTATPEKSALFEPKQSVTLSLSRDQGSNAQLIVNGKQIALPPPPAKGNITFEINKNNIAQIVQSGTISTGGATTNPANTNTR